LSMLIWWWLMLVMCPIKTWKSSMAHVFNPGLGEFHVYMVAMKPFSSNIWGKHFLSYLKWLNCDFLKGTMTRSEETRNVVYLTLTMTLSMLSTEEGKLESSLLISTQSG
jgi:hypothetical protein